MRRTAIAAAWLFGTTVPLVAAAVFVFGCCVLPFHGLIHRVLPLCHIASGLIHHHDDQTPAPAREKQEPVKRLVSTMPPAFALTPAGDRPRIVRASAATAYRSFISLGATRCDRDVGLHVVLETFLI